MQYSLNLGIRLTSLSTNSSDSRSGAKVLIELIRTFTTRWPLRITGIHPLVTDTQGGGDEPLFGKKVFLAKVNKAVFHGRDHPSFSRDALS